uniref:Uncharacterized protein n=1 Tax=Lotharella globosa TaxID=91324 RepID=A0A7S3Z0K2_9EUKA
MYCTIEDSAPLSRSSKNHSVATTCPCFSLLFLFSKLTSVFKDNLVNPESGEIEENFTVTLKDLYNPSNWVLDDYGRWGKFPRFVASPHPIWGLTAYVTKRVLAEITNSRKERRSSKL